jgi:hypothetical protein
LDPTKVRLPPTSPLALFSNGGERERERESLVYAFFFRTLHLSVSGKMAKFQGGSRFFFDSAYVLIVNVTSMDIVYLLSTNSPF